MRPEVVPECSKYQRHSILGILKNHPRIHKYLLSIVPRTKSFTERTKGLVTRQFDVPHRITIKEKTIYSAVGSAGGNEEEVADPTKAEQKVRDGRIREGLGDSIDLSEMILRKFRRN